MDSGQYLGRKEELGRKKVVNSAAQGEFVWCRGRWPCGEECLTTTLVE